MRAPAGSRRKSWTRSTTPQASEEEAGARLAQVITDPQCTQSGVYWSWNGNAQQVGLKNRVLDQKTGEYVWQIQGAGGAGIGHAHGASAASRIRL